MKMKFIVGIDADGTIFDSMNIKHKEVFWQCMVDKWDLSACEGEVLALGEKINLYSKNRGVNRFPALLMVMEGISALDGLDKSPLRAFVNSGAPLSNAGLKKYIEENGEDKLLADTLEWSLEVDRRFSEKTESLAPFVGADRAIRKISGDAVVVTVSSASRAILERDLANASLDSLVTKIMGQENGKKREQLLFAKKEFESDAILMIGDAISDCEAARSVGAAFYPILPGREEYSWERFTNKYFDAFISGEYKEKYEAALYEEFLNIFE